MIYKSILYKDYMGFRIYFKAIFLTNSTIIIFFIERFGACGASKGQLFKKKKKIVPNSSINQLSIRKSFVLIIKPYKWALFDSHSIRRNNSGEFLRKIYTVIEVSPLQ